MPFGSGLAPYGTAWQWTQALASATPFAASALGPGAAGTSSPTVLITRDQGASWMVATGVPTFTNSLANLNTKGTFPTPPVQFPYPPIGAPDLFNVYCASKSLCWTVGGNAALLTQAQGVPMASPSAVYVPPLDNHDNGNIGFLGNWGYGPAQARLSPPPRVLGGPRLARSGAGSDPPAPRSGDGHHQWRDAVAQRAGHL